MASLPLLIICMAFMYIGFLVCVIGTAVRVGRLIRAPLHLRWELYPVPHEKGYLAVRDEVPPLRGSGFAQFYHGGLGEELKEMLKEMIFLIRVWQGKRRIWFFSFALHDGIYLVLLWFIVLFLSALTELAGIDVSITSGNPWGVFLAWLSIILGPLGALAIAVGCVGLFIFRIVDSGMRQYATIREYFNLVFIAAIAIVGLIPICQYAVNALTSMSVFDVMKLVEYLDKNVFEPIRLQMLALVTFNPALLDKAASFLSDPVVLADQVLFFLFLLYYPFTKLVHGPAKYVSYHLVNWNDKPYQEGPLHYNYWGVIKIRER